MVLTIAVCYYAKLQDRKKFEKIIAPLLIKNVPDAAETLKDEIKRHFIL